MLAAVLWLGDVSFTVIDNENHVEPVVDEGINFLAYQSVIIQFAASLILIHTFLNTSYIYSILDP